MNRMLKRILIVLCVLTLVLFGVGAWYVNDYYHANSTALAAMEDGGNDKGTTSPVTPVSVQALSEKAVAFVPSQPHAGFIFYPGAKVQPEAYVPLMRRCAEQGVLSILVKPTFNLAILDPTAADGLAQHFPAIDRWFIGGHSLGGVVASQYAADHPGDFDAVVLLGSYSTANLSAFGGDVLLVCGSNDQVLNRQKYEEAKSNLPTTARELVIQGGNHAQFGNYGEQAGDGTATISAVDQQAQTAAAIANL